MTRTGRCRRKRKPSRPTKKRKRSFLNFSSLTSPLFFPLLFFFSSFLSHAVTVALQWAENRIMSRCVLDDPSSAGRWRRRTSPSFSFSFFEIRLPLLVRETAEDDQWSVHDKWCAAAQRPAAWPPTPRACNSHRQNPPGPLLFAISVRVYFFYFNDLWTDNHTHASHNVNNNWNLLVFIYWFLH